jgi:hypothetical protein
MRRWVIGSRRRWRGGVAFGRIVGLLIALGCSSIVVFSDQPTQVSKAGADTTENNQADDEFHNGASHDDGIHLSGG